MNDFGFVRLATCSLASQLLNCNENAKKIISLAQDANKKNIALLLFQELAITGATCGDMFFSPELLHNSKNAILEIAKASTNFSTILAVGFPFAIENNLYSAMALIASGKILAVIPLSVKQSPFTNCFKNYNGVKKNLQDIFFTEYEIPFGNFKFEFKNNSCLQNFSFKFTSYHKLNNASDLQDADLILVPSALPSFVTDELQERLEFFSAVNNSILLFANAGLNETSGENIFLGECGIFENGKTIRFNNIFSKKNKQPNSTEKINFNFSPLCISDCDVHLVQNAKLKEKKIFNENFETLQASENKITFVSNNKNITDNKSFLRDIKKHPFLPEFKNEATKKDFFIKLLDYSALALARRLNAINVERLVLGISGGLDSTFALLVAVRTMMLLKKDTKNIYAITMPCFGTTERTKNNAVNLAENLFCTVKTINISKTVESHFNDISHNINEHDLCFENAQARERTQVLMDISNKIKGIVISANDLSETALGWSTFAGDHISMYNVAASLPKTLLRKALKTFAKFPEVFQTQDAKVFSKILLDILDTPVSPELLPPSSEKEIVQKTENILGAYELHDFFIFHFIKNNFTKEKIIFLAKQAFAKDYTDKQIENVANVFFKRFFTSQFKRSCSPEGASVLPLSLSPRGSWEMPADLNMDFLKTF